MRLPPLALLSLSLTACVTAADWGTVFDAPALPEAAAFAVLANTSDGAYVVVLDEHGTQIERHWTGLERGDALAWDSWSDNFVVRHGGRVRVVEPHGARWDVARVDDVEAHGMGVAQDGSVFIAVEGTLMEIRGDDLREVTNASRCFWDVVADGPDRALSIDVMTGTITSWDTASGDVQNLFVYTDEEECWHEPGVVGRDRSGRIYVARTANGVITQWTGDTTVGFGDQTQDDDIDLSTLPTARTIARLDSHVANAHEAIAITPAGRDSVFVLYTGSCGEGVVTVSRNGQVTALSEATAEIWTDIVGVN